ncbi:uncharacterized protein [Amphiura filiformis]|uniref:uncharacterized protein n=1 Tax=Amphiura filiformis TaxID=82378 RepID=UPI003B227960
MTCFYLNTRSTKNKTVDLQAIVYSLDYDVILITESWLNSTIPDSFILPSGYVVYRNDRTGTRGGGVLIAVKMDLASHRHVELETYPESCVVEVNPQPGKSVLLSVVYRPPVYTNAGMEDMDMLSSFIDSIQSHQIKNKIIVGDFNLPRINWTLNEYTNDSRVLEREFCDVANACYLHQMVNFPTRFNKDGTGNILDLVLLWDPTLVDDLREGCDNIGSDHTAITFSIPILCKRVKQPKRTVYNFKRADWSGLKNALLSHSWNLDDNDIDVLWDNWNTSLCDIVDTFIPKVHCKSLNSAPWIDSEIINIVKKKERAWVKFKKTGNSIYWDKFRSLRKQSKSLIKRKRADFIFEVRDSLRDNPKRFWSFHKIKNPGKIPHSITYNNSTTSIPAEQASLFNKYFHSVFRNKDSFDIACISDNSNDTNSLCSILFSATYIFEF